MNCARSAVPALVAGAIALSATVATADTVGPDNFGYEGDDSVVSAFEDISGSATHTFEPLPGNFDATDPGVGIGFTFDFYGAPFSSVWINENGFLSFQDPGSGSATSQNVDLSTSMILNDAPTIAVFWDDLDATSDNNINSRIMTETRGTAGNDLRFIVQWEVEDGFAQLGGLQFQVVLFEGTNDIVFRYADVISGNPFNDNGIGATIGIRNSGADVNGEACQYSFDTASVIAGDAILFTVPGGGGAPDPTDELNTLVADVEVINLNNGISNALDSKLDAALNALDDANVNNDGAAVNALNAFINYVEAQRGNQISEAEADALIADAQAIIDMLNGS